MYVYIYMQVYYAHTHIYTYVYKCKYIYTHLYHFLAYLDFPNQYIELIFPTYIVANLPCRRPCLYLGNALSGGELS
jgi:hypothetical protein